MENISPLGPDRPRSFGWFWSLQPYLARRARLSLLTFEDTMVVKTCINSKPHALLHMIYSTWHVIRKDFLKKFRVLEILKDLYCISLMRKYTSVPYIGGISVRYK